MPSDYYFGYYFYAPNGRFEPCGMFTSPHIISVVISTVLIVLSLITAKRKLTGTTKIRFLRISAVSLTVLETIKISHSFIFGDYYLDAWFPLSYCGLFIFALWMVSFGKGNIKRAGESFIAYGCPIAGILFLIFPTTSLMSYPIWHFFSLYSLLYHSLMIFTGIVLLSDEERLDRNTYICYCGFVLTFSVIAIVINSLFQSNLMNLREPYNIPIEFLQKLYREHASGYTMLVVFAYSIMPFFTNFVKRKANKR